MKSIRINVGILNRLDKNGELKVRVFHQFTYEDGDALDAFLRQNTENDLFSDEHRLSALKLYKDGSLGARTALMRRAMMIHDVRCGYVAG